MLSLLRCEDEQNQIHYFKINFDFGRINNITCVKKKGRHGRIKASLSSFMTRISSGLFKNIFVPSVKLLPVFFSVQLTYKEFMVIYSLCWFSLQGFLFLVSLSCKGE